jgi:hypothetical protein
VKFAMGSRTLNILLFSVLLLAKVHTGKAPAVKPQYLISWNSSNVGV